jgi:hypothetical protein
MTLYAELIEYIYYHCQEFQTTDEIIAGRTAMYRKQLNQSYKEVMISKGWYKDAEQIKAMIGNSIDEFKVNVAIRIFNEHRDELNLNLCPKCFKIARTPLAKQCRFCFHNWH